jgi:hypothetical protein
MRASFRIRQESLMTAEAVAQDDIHYTSSVDFDRCTGEACLYIVSTAGKLIITQQCSLNNTDWYNPINASGSAVGSIAAALTVTTGVYITFSPVLSPYIRFKVEEDNTAATVVTIKLLFQV